MSSPILATLAVFLAWWLSTGLILWRVRVADNAGPLAHRASVFFALPLLGVGFWGAVAFENDASAQGIYIGFASALALWGWVELAFLSGIISGPNRVSSPAGLPPRARFSRAFLAVAWHEAALVAVMSVLIVVQHGADNQIASATFALLLGARTLAKINLFLGVPRINLQFIPRPIAHLKSHFRLSPATVFLPVSIGILTLTVGILGLQAVRAALPETTLAYTVMTSLAALALLEHLFMVLPLPDAKLWAWMLPKAKPTMKILEDTHGL